MEKKPEESNQNNKKDESSSTDEPTKWRSMRVTWDNKITSDVHPLRCEMLQAFPFSRSTIAVVAVIDTEQWKGGKLEYAQIYCGAHLFFDFKPFLDKVELEVRKDVPKYLNLNTPIKGEGPDHYSKVANKIGELARGSVNLEKTLDQFDLIEKRLEDFPTNENFSFDAEFALFVCEGSAIGLSQVCQYLNDLQIKGVAFIGHGNEKAFVEVSQNDVIMAVSQIKSLQFVVLNQCNGGEIGQQLANAINLPVLTSEGLLGAHNFNTSDIVYFILHYLILEFSPINKIEDIDFGKPSSWKVSEIIAKVEALHQLAMSVILKQFGQNNGNQFLVLKKPE